MNMKKVFTLFSLLLCVLSSAWADGYTPSADEVIILNEVYSASATTTGYSTHAAVAWGGTASTTSKKAGDPSNNGAATSSNVACYSVKGNGKGKNITINISGCSKIIVYHESHSSRYLELRSGGKSGTLIGNGSTSTYYTEVDLDGTKSYSIFLHGTAGSDDQDFYVYAVKLVKYVNKTISTQALSGVKVNGLALTENAETAGYSVSGSTITLTDVAYVVPTNVTLTNHITYTDNTTEDKNVAVTFEATPASGYWSGTASIGTTAYTVRIPYSSQSVTGITINGTAISDADLATLTSTKAVSIDGSSLNGIGMIGVTLSGGTANVTRTNSGNDVVFKFTINASDEYTVTVTNLNRNYTTFGNIVYYSKDGTNAEGANTKAVTANGITFAMVDENKTLQYGSGKVTIGGAEYTPLKLSTGSAVSVTFPEGKKATKVKVYGWSANGDGKMNSIQETSDENGKKVGDMSADIFYATNTDKDIYPSVYEYELDNWESMYFSCGGSPSQPFVIMDFVFAETQCATPVIAPADGASFSDDTQEVTISCTTDGATVYYTLDGSEPTTSSTVYTDAFNISSTTTVKAFAVKDGLDDSQVATATINKVVSVVTNSWDFTAWSSETKAGVIADTEDWNQYEKANNGGLDFDQNGRSNVSSISSGSSLMYSNTNIAETDGLTFASDAFGLGLIFNLPSATISSTEYTYHGSSYLWLYNKDAVITIPSVPAGATIEIGVESHNGGDARGVTLKNGSTTLTQTDGASTSKVYQVCKWTNATAGNVTVTPSKGIHIYYIKVFSNVETIPVSTKADRSYATCVAEKALDFTEVADEVTAYIATSLNSDNSSVIIEQVTKVPLGEPILVKTATQGTTVNVPVIATAEALTANKFAAGDGVTDVTTANDTYYFLKEDMFHKATSGILQKGKAYLKIEGGSNARELSIDFSDGETTGIKNVVNGSKNWFDGEFYNLSGQRVAKPTKGLYIVNGKKIIVK